MSLRLVQLVTAAIEPLRRLLLRSRKRSWSREESESREPRRFREGREREVTLLFVQFTPRQAAEQAVAVVPEGRVQLLRRVPWVSVWERKRESAAVSLEEREITVERESERRKRREKGRSSIAMGE